MTLYPRGRENKESSALVFSSTPQPGCQKKEKTRTHHFNLKPSRLLAKPTERQKPYFIKKKRTGQTPILSKATKPARKNKTPPFFGDFALVFVPYHVPLTFRTCEEAQVWQKNREKEICETRRGKRLDVNL